MRRRLFSHLREAQSSSVIRPATPSRREVAGLAIRRLLRTACVVFAVLVANAALAEPLPFAGATATGAPQQASGGATLPTAPSVDCVTNCLRVNDIRLTAHNADLGVRVGAFVHVVDENGRPVPLVIVTVIWTKPNGSGHLFITSTDGRGIAPFRLPGDHGTYALTVESLEREGYTFDTDDSVREVSITF